MSQITLPLDVKSLEIVSQRIDLEGNIILKVISTNDHSTCYQCGKPAVKSEIGKLNQGEFVILDEILSARKAAELSQAQVAKHMGAQARAIARLEGALATGKLSPSLSTLRKYAAALGKRVELHLV